jgi:hypothetical protein
MHETLTPRLHAFHVYNVRTARWKLLGTCEGVETADRNRKSSAKPCASCIICSVSLTSHASCTLERSLATLNTSTWHEASVRFRAPLGPSQARRSLGLVGKRTSVAVSYKKSYKRVLSFQINLLRTPQKRSSELCAPSGRARSCNWHGKSAGLYRLITCTQSTVSHYLKTAEPNNRQKVKQ